MVSNIKGLLITVVFAYTANCFCDGELDKLKAETSKVNASLSISKSTGTIKEHEYIKYTFVIDTMTKKYRLAYKTFAKEKAIYNQQLLSDYKSGYGMLEPYPYWYSQGFINCFFSSQNPKEENCIATVEGVPVPLKTEGGNVAYDIVFKCTNCCIIIRTAAIAGKDELYIKIITKSFITASSDKQIVGIELWGYPFGFNEPFDRLVIGDGSEFNNEGKINKLFPVDLSRPGWLLMTDKIAEKKNMPGMLGIIYEKTKLQNIKLEHKMNYAVLLDFRSLISSGESIEQNFILYSFGKVTQDEARKKLSEDEANSATMLKEAFRELPEPTF